MKTYGYIHLHRSLLSWPYHNNPSLLSVWMHLLMLAEYEDCQYDGVTIHRGELLVSQQWLAEMVGLSINQVRTCLSTLEKANEITKKRTNNLTHIKILKFNEYQGDTSGANGGNNARNCEHGHEQNNERNNERNNDIGKNINNNNKKNLSDGERQRGDRRSFILQLDASVTWKEKCCRDYNIEPSQMKRHIIAFHEHLLRNAPNKSWLSFSDFCLHFHSWLRFQTPESIHRLATQALLRYRQQVARKVEEERQQQMWKEIEEAKRKAVKPPRALTPLGG